MKELFKERETVKSAYQKAEKALLEKKEKLWKAKEKDIYKWGSEDPIKLERIKDQLYGDKKLAFSHMLAKDT